MKPARFLLLGAFTGILAATVPAHAETRLDLINPPGQTNTPFNLPFVATGSSTTISIGGYQLPSFEQSADNGVFLNGSGSNLLGSTWTFTPAASGSDADTFNDGTSVPALDLGGVTVGDLDTFSQTFATTPGDTYVIELLFSNDFAPDNEPSEFRVSTSALEAVPLPAALPLFTTGLGALGLLGWRRKRRAQAVA